MTEFERMVMLLDSAYQCRDEIVICLQGPVGIGKTAAVRQHAKNVGAKNVVTIIASQILPSEVSGITMPDAETRSMEIYDHYKLSHLEDGDVLFFDELLEADQSVLSACLTLIESRMLMSGKLLPDIQIIAATNPTISAITLKENIRQRFMFAEFSIDKVQVHQYIKEQYDLDLNDTILSKLEGTSNKYNILSPRSLSKLCKWITSVDADDLDNTAELINYMWDCTIGTDLKRLRLKNMTPEYQTRKILMDLIPDKKVEFNNCTFTEMMDILTSLPEWESIKEQLKSMEVVKYEENIKF